MKLFNVSYCDDCDFENYLTVGDSIEEVEVRELKNYKTNVVAL